PPIASTSPPTTRPASRPPPTPSPSRRRVDGVADGPTRPGTGSPFRRRGRVEVEGPVGFARKRGTERLAERDRRIAGPPGGQPGEPMLAPTQQLTARPSVLPEPALGMTPAGVKPLAAARKSQATSPSRVGRRGSQGASCPGDVLQSGRSPEFA